MGLPDPERARNPSLPPLRVTKPLPKTVVDDTNGLPYPDTDLPPTLQQTIYLRLKNEPQSLDTTDTEAMEETIKRLFAPGEPPD